MRRTDRTPHRLLPYICIPAGAERAVRRRLRSRSDSQPLSVVSHRARLTRRLRRILARSRSVGSCTRERSHRHAYERSHSCPEYPVYTNTYKITENKKDYIFHMALSRAPKPAFLTTLSLNREQKTLPANVYYGPVPIQTKIQMYSCRRKIHIQPESSNWYSDNSISLETDDNQPRVSIGIRRRRLPNVESLPNPRVRSLPDIPTVNTIKNIRKDPNQNVTNSGSAVDISQEEIHTQYHGYNSDASDAETTIHVSVDNQKRLDGERTKTNKNPSFETMDPNTRQSKNSDLNTITSQTNRKKFLSLDLKTNYDQKSPNQTQSLDTYRNIKENIMTPKNDNSPKVDILENSKSIESIRRRNSDSLVMLKISPPTLSTPDQIKNMFKRMSITSKNPLDTSTESKDKYITKKCGNTVSINEIPTFQEYRSPNSLSPQSSIDLSFKKPLPSIIKKARTRSYSIAATDHLDREFSIMANSLSVALSPPNLGSPRRALTPVASHLPLDDTHQNIHDATIEPSDLDESTACATSRTTQSTSLTNYYRCDGNRINKQSMKKREKPTTRRNSKRSNDYGGRENGRGSNQQQQPLERRESRRGQFTRSLSNADVPPDEKAGNLSIIIIVQVD